MMYEEFAKLAGCEIDQEMYNAEVEPTYMAFDSLTKQEIAAMYMGTKKGAYELWLRGKTLARELAVLDEACEHLQRIGMAQNAADLKSYWNVRAHDFIKDVKAAIHALEKAHTDTEILFDNLERALEA